jgi:hypothetical protein
MEHKSEDINIGVEVIFNLILALQKIQPLTLACRYGGFGMV